MALLYCKIATQYSQHNFELLGQKYKLYIMNFYVLVSGSELLIRFKLQYWCSSIWTK
jgi:hypothetical protein